MPKYQPDHLDWTWSDWWNSTKNGVNDPNPGMRSRLARRVVFIPWKATEDIEWRAKTQNWIDINRSEKGKVVEMLHWDPANAPNHTLVGLTTLTDAVVYIRGHGSPSSLIIGNRHKFGTETIEDKLPITEACQRLIDMGLDPQFAGTIKALFVLQRY